MESNRRYFGFAKQSRSFPDKNPLLGKSKCYKTPMGKIKKLIQDITDELQKAFTLSTSGIQARTLEQTTLALPFNNPVQPHRADGSNMEVFLRDIAMHKIIRFTAEQLQFFTANFSTVLGSGGFGVVYKGQLPNGDKIAVKVLNRSLNSGVKEQFMAEIGTIGRIYHINIVRLYGFCHDNMLSALVYEYMENGSLDRFLFGKERIIEWSKLHDIAIGAAKGIAYMHEECPERIIHYDVKPGNILLDANFCPKIADFGLAKLRSRDDTHDSISGYRGTPGYSAPELLLLNYRITQKCDVYSFGMLLFEIVGRKRNSDVASSRTSMNWFPKHVWEEYEKGELSTTVMACGIEKKDREKAERMCMVALWCVQDSPDARPPMSAIVKMLEDGVEIVPPPKPFSYFNSVAVNPLMASNVSSGVSSSSSYSMSEGNSSTWFRETKPLMPKHGTRRASHS